MTILVDKATHRSLLRDIRFIQSFSLGEMMHSIWHDLDGAKTVSDPWRCAV